MQKTTHNKKDIEYAETIALKAIHFILEDDILRETFIRTTGILPSDFQNLINDQEFFAGSLDFLLEQENQLIGFCSKYGLSPDEPAKARRLLPGATIDF